MIKQKYPDWTYIHFTDNEIVTLFKTLNKIKHNNKNNNKFKNLYYYLN
jgi:hypothetical protein